MTTREAARPLRRYMRARVRAASLPPSYTITRDVTRARAKNLIQLDCLAKIDLLLLLLGEQA
jgi:hypothetical protein